MKAVVNIRLFSIALLVAIVHLASGLDIWLSHANYALHTTPLHLIAVAFGNSSTAVGLVLIITSILAFIPFLIKNASRGMLVYFIFPQQVLLFLHLFSVLGALITGHYPDGYMPEGAANFIFNDQIWLTGIVFWHTIEYLITLTLSSFKGENSVEKIK